MRRRFRRDVVRSLTLLTAASLILLPTLMVSAQEQPVQIWQTTWGDTGYDVGSGVAVDDDIYVVGTLDYFGTRAGDAFLAKYDQWRTQLWNATWGGPDSDVGLGVAVGSDLYVVGTTGSFGAGSSDAFLVKYDREGNQIWNVTWGGDGEDWGYGVAVRGDVVYVTGETASFGAGSGDVFLAAYAGGETPTLLWNVTWGGTDGDVGYGVAVSGDVIYITGFTASFGAGGNDVFLAAYAGGETPTLLWNVTWGGDGEDWGYGVAVGSDLYVVGTTGSFGAGYMDAFVVRYGFVPVGGTVLSISPVESLLYVAITLSSVALLAMAKIRRRIRSAFSATSRS